MLRALPQDLFRIVAAQAGRCNGHFHGGAFVLNRIFVPGAFQAGDFRVAQSRQAGVSAARQKACGAGQW